MSKTARHRLNALVLALLAGHAVYWFATGQAEGATSLMVALRVAQAVVGAAGAIWFLARSRGASQ
jgi:hypothetical protein